VEWGGGIKEEESIAGEDHWKKKQTRKTQVVNMNKEEYRKRNKPNRMV
jgi:hypothetical protein